LSIQEMYWDAWVFIQCHFRDKHIPEIARYFRTVKAGLGKYQTHYHSRIAFNIY